MHRAARAGNEEVVWKLLHGDLSSADELAKAADKVSLLQVCGLLELRWKQFHN